MTDLPEINPRNMWIMARKFYRPDTKVVGDIYCPDDMVYFIDERGEVHAFTYAGRLPHTCIADFLTE